MVTKEEVEKAEAEWKAAKAAAVAVAATDAYDAVYDAACAYVAADEAWDKYVKLEREYNNGNLRGCRES